MHKEIMPLKSSGKRTPSKKPFSEGILVMKEKENSKN